jgi:hypothetical protein
MNKRWSKSVGVWGTISGIALGCGPFFPDTMLYQPQAALAVPVVSYLHDLHQFAGTSQSPSPPSSPAEFTFLAQIPLEVAELKALWRSEDVEEKEVERRAEHYTEVRMTLLKPLTEVTIRDFPKHPEGSIDLPARPLGDGFPVEVADYVEAARLHAVGKTDEARELWKAILGRPVAEKKLRSLWAAWMLAKTSASEQECMEWYAQVEEEAKLGGTDVLGLRAAAKSWRAPRLEDPLESVRMLYESFAAGRESAAIDLRRASYALMTSKDQEILAKAAADPTVTALLNLHLHGTLNSLKVSRADENPSDTYDTWFATLEKHPDSAITGAARIAWAHYSAGRYEESRRWLKLAKKDDALTLWLKAKFALRDGDTTASARFLAEAIQLRSGEADWKPANFYSESRWHEGAEELQSLRDGHLLAESGVVSLAQGEYVAALDQLRRAGYWTDAAYVAENVLSPNVLLAYVRKTAPEWKQGAGDAVEPGERNYGRGTDPDNRLRWVLARRLNREKRFPEAREFIPPDLVATFDRYVALDKARRSGRYAGEKRAAILWEQARMHRHFGAELFSTESAPDGGAYDWNYSVGDLTTARNRKDGWTSDPENWRKFVSSEKPEHRAIPSVNPDEMVRARRYGLKNRNRFHYRYDAADLAWEAGKSLPANHPLLAQLYTTAGYWLASSDPAAADRFYQAIVRRCAETPAGKAAEAKRWFSADLAILESMPSLPPEFARNPERELAW